jgi:hypothetical protein
MPTNIAVGITILYTRTHRTGPIQFNSIQFNTCCGEKNLSNPTSQTQHDIPQQTFLHMPPIKLSFGALGG